MTLALRRREKKTDLNNKWLQPSPRLSPEKLASKKDRKLQNTMMTGNFFSVLLFLKNLLQSSGLRRTTFESMLPWDGPTLEWRHLLSGRLFQMRNFHLIYFSLSLSLSLSHSHLGLFNTTTKKKRRDVWEWEREFQKTANQDISLSTCYKKLQKIRWLAKICWNLIIKKTTVGIRQSAGIFPASQKQSGTKISWLVLFTFYYYFETSPTETEVTTQKLCQPPNRSLHLPSLLSLRF
jgi:hypothetical protein